MSKKRNLGIDVLRAIAMFFVICQHMLGQGGLVENAEMGTGRYYVLWFLQILVYCAVNIYGITTGYLLCRKRFRLSRLTKLWLTTVFWSVAVSCAFFLLKPETRTFEETVSMFLPILRGRYWFFTAYFVVMMVSPALNVLINTLSRRQFHLLFAALFVIFGIIPVGSLGNDVLRISTGHHFSWMIVLYLIGGYLNVHGNHAHTGADKKTILWLGGYFLLAGVHLLYQVFVTSVGLLNFRWLLLTYPSPLVLGEAICLFQYFKETGNRIQGTGLMGRLIRFAAPGIYSVYIIHVHPKIFWSKELIALLRPWDTWGTAKVFGAMAAAAFGVFTVCILLDKIRQWLFRVFSVDKAADRISDWTEQKLRRLLASESERK